MSIQWGTGTALTYSKVGIISEYTGRFYFSKINIANYVLSLAENLNKLFTDLGGKFNYSAQDRDLEYFFFWEISKNLPVSSDYQKSVGNRINAALEIF